MINHDIENYSKKHKRDLNIASGGNGKTSLRYEFITSQNELIDSYLHRMDDLGYPLRVEPKRDRYVVNKKALQDALEHATVQALKQMDKELTDFMYTEVRAMLEDNIQDVFNEINVINNNFVVKPSRPKKSHSERFAEQLGKALGKSIADIVDDIFFPKGKY